MGGFLKYLGFAIPLSLAIDPVGGDPAKPARDRLPGMGTCVLCKRQRAVTYQRGDGNRVCVEDIGDTVHSKAVRRTPSQRRPVNPQPEVVHDRPMDDFSARQWVWNSWFA